jgi:membrane-associated protease RseP (regulator of RpoE activity)
MVLKYLNFCGPLRYKSSQAGIRPGDLVAEVAGDQVSSSDAFSQAIEDRIGLEPLRFLVVRNGRGYYLDLP